MYNKNINKYITYLKNSQINITGLNSVLISFTFSVLDHSI